MATTCKITKLLKGNEYLFRVRAVNKYGEGENLESEPITAMDPFTIPSPPTDVEVTSATNEAMTICWKRPASDGGCRISGYITEKREKHGIRWVRVNKKPVYDLRVKASGLQKGCEYEFRVFAENAAGLSEPSLPCPLTLAEDPKFLPSPPAKPTIVDSTRSSITLSWNKPLFDGGAAITGYKVEFRKSTEEDWAVGVYNTEKTTFTVTGLTSGAEYIFIVRSINKIGISEPSPETNPEKALQGAYLYCISQTVCICSRNRQTCLFATLLLLLLCCPQTSRWKSELATFIPAPHVKVTPICGEKVTGGCFFLKLNV
uniref:Fibronectin type-III domain-containing protein n=1 Tax=Monopterus albus TaxID=43700 RepID=A0A3Q3KBC3_MONAL